MAEDILLTQESYDKLKEELESLKKEVMPLIVKRIEEAMKLGDLSENAEYHGAKDDQGWAAAKIREIESNLERAKIVEKTAGKVVDIGSKLTIADEAGKEKEVEIVDQMSAAPMEGKISDKSPMGAALVGHREGDKVKVELPLGPKLYTIKKVL